MHVAIVNITAGGISGGYRKYLQKIVPLLGRDQRVTSLDVFVPEQIFSTFSFDVGNLYSIAGSDLYHRYSKAHSQTPRSVARCYICTECSPVSIWTCSNC